MTTVQTINNSAKMNDTMPTLRKIKREATQPTKANAVASHFILPSRTMTSTKLPFKTVRMIQKKRTVFQQQNVDKKFNFADQFLK